MQSALSHQKVFEKFPEAESHLYKSICGVYHLERLANRAAKSIAGDGGSFL